jgi:hypothetical protein
LQQSQQLQQSQHFSSNSSSSSSISEGHQQVKESSEQTCNKKKSDGDEGVNKPDDIDAVSVLVPAQSPAQSQFLLVDVEVARERDLGTNDNRLVVRTHLGHLLKCGDTARGCVWVLPARLPAF